MASSSSSSHHPRYQVFLSFRGKDTRLNFTSHLLEALEGRRIKAFFDEKELEKGEELSPTLLNAIKASKVSIIILSEDYASSNSCLTELSEIMECKTQGQIVLPIFYRVDPSDVRHHRESFKQSFDQHLEEKREEVERWKTAFTQVGKLKGWHIHKSSDRSEAEYVKDIVKVVIEKLRSKATYKSEDLVGTDDQIEEILLHLEKEDIRTIGIWGMGGIGKTTLADAIYNEVLSRSDKFDAHHFLRNVRQRSLETNGLQSQSLRRELLSQLLGEDINIDTPSIGCTLIKDRLQNLKVLVVLDDVDNLDQIEHLGVTFFGPGSKIIVTSRDRQVLLNIGVDICHRVNELSEYNSLQLFSKHAFKQDNPVAGFQYLAMKFVGYAGGIPLALKVLGAALLGKSRGEWESAWDKREEYPEERFFGPLKISYDGLDDLGKNIFLDIACFHNGRRKYDVEEILLISYKGAKFAIGNLVDKCLIDGDRYTFRMHDLLQEMGRYIVCQESKDPGRRSRLWSPSDVYYVLQNNKGTRSIKGISMNMDAIKPVCIRRDAFKEMVDLKFIRFHNAGFGMSCNKLLLSNNKLKYLPDELRYFHWDDCPLKSLPSNFSPNNLVKLSLSRSNIEQLWSGDEVVNLKALDVSWCKNLRKIPSLLGATKLERLNCNRCQNLVELPCMTHLTSLKELYLLNCPITKFPEIPTNGALKILNLGGTRIEEVPSLHLTSGQLNLDGCPITNFPKIPTNGALEILNLHKRFLEQLFILDTSVRKIQNISSSILKLHFLSEICLFDITKLNFNTPSIEEEHGLVALDVRNCKSLKSLLGLPRVIYLRAENCTSLERVSFIDRDPGNNYESIFDFSNCSKLSDDIIAVYPMIICPYEAKRSAKRLPKDELDDFTDWNTRISLFCQLPRSEISEKFQNQNRNSWITVKLGPATGTRFLCFALCLVLDSDVLPHGTCRDYYIECKYQLKGGIDGDKNCRLSFWSRPPMLIYKSSGQHLYLLFGEKMVHRDMQYTKASFAFRVFVGAKKRKVEKCGVHVFYVDVESFAVSHAVSSIDFSSDGQDIDFSSDEDTSCGEGSTVEEDEDATSSMVEENPNVKNDHDDPARTIQDQRLAPKRILSSNDEGDHPDKRLKRSYSS